MYRRTRQPSSADPAVAVPRDVEAVEAVINALNDGVADSAAAHRIIAKTLTAELGLDYGAAWVLDDDGGKPLSAVAAMPLSVERFLHLAIAATAVGLVGRESDIFRKVIWWSLSLLLALCLLVGLQSSVLSWMLP